MRSIQLREHHRVVIPADIVRELGLAVGDQLLLEVVNDTILLVPQAAATRRLREGFSNIPRSLADRLLANRQVQ